nr:high mobility group B protein 15-like [Nicotiana tomentosiformis]
MVEVVDVAGCILIFCFTFRAETASPSTGSPVCGVIDGKFESGYLITVKIGSEDFKGVLYQVPINTMHQELQNQNLPVYNTGKAASATNLKMIDARAGGVGVGVCVCARNVGVSKTLYLQIHMIR